MWSKLEEVFEEIGLDYDRQGSYADGREYPPSFFTFWNHNTADEAFYDNKSNKSIWHWNVYYYTNDPATMYTQMDEFVKIAEQKGFIVEGRGFDVRSDRADYVGRMIRIIYIETL